MPISSPPMERLLASSGPQFSGIVTAADGMSLKIAGLVGHARLGDQVSIAGRGRHLIRARIVAFNGNMATAIAYDLMSGAAAGNVATLTRDRDEVFPCQAWLGRVIDPFSNAADGKPLKTGGHPYPLERPAPNAAQRKLLGPRLSTGYRAFDTFLPICQGQRIGLFAGAGVGKSSLLGGLVKRIDCDVAVIALIGERGREVRSFVEQTLGREGMKKAVVIASTADQSPLAKKQAAFMAMATAEYFRDQNKQVLFIIDSLTRFAEAHREIALAAGEVPSLHAFPPSTFRVLASLVERAGPGEAGQGDITAVLSVLVAGSDMNEPVADMIRGILDGHVILERQIAERGRFPAIDISRSISRSLPEAASADENKRLVDARSILRIYEDAETIVRAGLYAPGSDPRIDQALKIWPALDEFISEQESMGCSASFRRLQSVLEVHDDVLQQ